MKAEAKKKLRSWVAWRDKHKCFWCGRKLVIEAEGWPKPFNMATLDHIEPKAKGGKTNGGNLVLSCFPCNNARGDMPAEDFLRLIQGH